MRHIAVVVSLASWLFLFMPSGFAQDTEPSTGNPIAASSSATQDPTAALAALAQAFSQGKPVSSVTLAGNATWTAGSLDDSGSVSIAVSGTAPTVVKLSLSKVGTRSETFSGTGTNMTCQWTDASANNHVIGSTNCWKPFLWFLPAFFLQPSQIPATIGVLDLGSGTVGSSTTLYHHLLGAIVLDHTSSQQTTDVMRWSSEDLGLDPTTSLPAALAYTVVADKGADTPISIEIRYGNYTTVNGVAIPFSIQRYVNGTLQLDLSIQNAQVN